MSRKAQSPVFATSVAAEPTAKVAFQVNYAITVPGHNPENREVMITAEKMSDAILHVEGIGGAVTSALAMGNGSQCIQL